MRHTNSGRLSFAQPMNCCRREPSLSPSLPPTHEHDEVVFTVIDFLPFEDVFAEGNKQLFAGWVRERLKHSLSVLPKRRGGTRNPFVPTGTEGRMDCAFRPVESSTMQFSLAKHPA